MTRSAAETEIRESVVARLRLLRPSARICHEVNVSSFGPTRMDLIAVDTDELIAVEIKSAKDVMKRAETQIRNMNAVAHHTIIALHEVHLVEQETNEWAAHYGRRDGKHYLQDVPPEAKLASLTWAYPERSRSPAGLDYHTGTWREPERRYLTSLPSPALDMLWRDELAWLCGTLRVSCAKRATMTDMLRELRWHCNGKELTRGICVALRRRKFAEADDAILETQKNAAADPSGSAAAQTF